MRRLDHRIILSGIASLTPMLVALVWAMLGRPDPRLIAALAIGSLIIFAAVIKSQIGYPLRTIANLISALREEDYSIRARGARRSDPMGEVLIELNLLADTLRERRLTELEAAALLRAVFEHIDSAIFAFDEQWNLRLVNKAAERLLGRSAEQLAGRTAAQLGMETYLTGDETRTAEVVMAGGHGRFRIRRTTFRESGVPHLLVSMADLSRALREEERLAWQRILRVLSHELNNSLAPIRSIAGSLSTILGREPLPEGWRDDAKRGLSVIDSRAEGLARFLQAYSQLARLPQPTLRPVNVGETVRRVAGLETRVEVKVDGGPDVTVKADRDQLEQLLINLIRNAVDAVKETGGGVTASWSAGSEAVEILIVDEGVGISGTGNLFVPFFTTKPGGSGIGLTLARQIAEAHDGAVTLSARPGPERGTVARLRLPR